MFLWDTCPAFLLVECANGKAAALSLSLDRDPGYQAGLQQPGRRVPGWSCWKWCLLSSSLNKYHEAIFKQGFECFLWNSLKNNSFYREVSLPVSFSDVILPVLDRFSLLSTDMFFHSCFPDFLFKPGNGLFRGKKKNKKMKYIYM